MLQLRQQIQSMNPRILKWTSFVVVGALSLAQSFAALTVSKTMRVDHGRPVVVASQKSVLLLEFAKEPITDALVPNSDSDVRHCRARYRYQFYDGWTGSVTNGQGTVEEIYKTVLRGATGNQVKDVGSRVGISAGDFHLTWSEGGAGGAVGFIIGPIRPCASSSNLIASTSSPWARNNFGATWLHATWRSSYRPESRCRWWAPRFSPAIYPRTRRSPGASNPGACTRGRSS